MRPIRRLRALPALVLSPLALLLALGCSGAGESSDASLPVSPNSGAAGAAPSADMAASKAVGFTLGRQAVREASAARGMPAPPPPPPPMAAPAPDAPGGDADAVTRAQGSVAATAAMLIRTGSASVEVSDLDQAMAQVAQLATGVGGFVAGTSVAAGRDQVRAATLEVRIPAARWDEALRGLEPLGRVEAVNVSAEDVGEEFTDLTARAANARRLEERLVELLATRTGKLDDVLSVERELARVREQIERMEGRMRFLQARAATSTLSISLHEPFPVLGQRGPNPIGEAFRDAWRNFVGFVAACISALGILVPLGALGLAAWLVIRRFVPKRAAEGRAAA